MIRELPEGGAAPCLWVSFGAVDGGQPSLMVPEVKARIWADEHTGHHKIQKPEAGSCLCQQIGTEIVQRLELVD